MVYEKRLYIKNRMAFAAVGCAPAIWSNLSASAKGVPTNNQRGRGSEPCLLLGGLDKIRYMLSPHRLLSQGVVKKLVQCYGMANHITLDDQRVILSTSRAFRRLPIFEHDAQRLWPSSVWTIDRRRRAGELFLLKHSYNEILASFDKLRVGSEVFF